MKKIVIIALCIIMAFALAGCGKTKTPAVLPAHNLLKEKAEQENTILITCPELGLEEEYVLPENQREEFDSCYKDLKVGERILSSSKAWKIAVDGDDIFLYEAFLDRQTAAVKIKMQWKENKFEVMNTEILEEYL